MKCEKVLDEYCKLDKNESLPFNISMHIIVCPRCKEIISQMHNVYELHFVNFNASKNTNEKENLVIETMQKIKRLNNAKPKAKKSHRGEFTFFVIIMVLCVLPFGILPTLKIGQVLIETLGVFFVLPLGLLCAFVVSLISAIFIIRNRKYFVKRFGI
ncbi:MAG: hypothetical protein P1P64_06480 [Treponemataceae bacterium]